jgi:hypothetical protein
MFIKPEKKRRSQLSLGRQRRHRRTMTCDKTTNYRGYKKPAVKQAKFMGKCDDLHGYIYDRTGSRQADALHYARSAGF